jgi:hypothetical protein
MGVGDQFHTTVVLFQDWASAYYTENCMALGTGLDGCGEDTISFPRRVSNPVVYSRHTDYANPAPK